jgi:hypothetical protein
VKTEQPDLNAQATALGYKTGPIADVAVDIARYFPPNGAGHAYLWWATQTTDAPVIFHIASILAAAATELTRRGWCISAHRYPIRLWMAMVAGPGVGKSTAINTARDFYTEVCAKYRETGAKWVDPYVTADGSTQGLFEVMARLYDNERDVTPAILVREEFSVLLNPRRRDDFSMALCEWADGRHHQRHTRGLQQAAQRGEQAHSELKNPRISATFVTTQQSLFDTATMQHMQGGLFSRLLWFVASGADIVPKMHHRRRPAERAAVLGLWARWLSWLDGVESSSESKVVEVAEEVEKYLEDTLFADYVTATRSGDPLAAHYKRGIQHAYVLAGVYAMMCGRTVILAEDMHRAVNLLNECLTNIADLAPEVGTSPVMKAANRAFEFIRSAGERGVTRSALYRRLQVPKHELQMVVDTLEDEGSIRESVKVSGKRGRNAIRYIAIGSRRYEGPAQDGAVVAFPVDETGTAE